MQFTNRSIDIYARVKKGDATGIPR